MFRASVKPLMVAVLLVVTSCGGDASSDTSGEDQSTSPPPTTAAPATTASPGSTAADQVSPPGTDLRPVCEPHAPTSLLEPLGPGWPAFDPNTCAQDPRWEGSAAVIYQAPGIPTVAAADPDGEIYYTSPTFTGDTRIYHLVAPDQPELFTTPDLATEILDFAFTSDGRLLVAPNQDGTIWEVDVASGSTTPYVEGALGFFELTSTGSVVTTNRLSDFWVIDPTTGSRDEYVFDFDLAWGLAVAPDDTVVVTVNDGSIYDVTDPANPRLLSDEMPLGVTGGESIVAFTPDGRLYWNGAGLHEIDVRDGSVISVWGSPIGFGGEMHAVAPGNRLLTFHPNDGIFVLDPRKREVDQRLAVLSNTSALGIAGDTVYAAYRTSRGTAVFSADEGGLAEVMAFPDIDLPMSLSFGVSTGYLSGIVFGDDGNPAAFPIVAFDPTDPTSRTTVQAIGPCLAYSVAVDRTTDTLYWADCMGVTARQPDGTVTTVPLPAGTQSAFISVVDGGPLYAVLWSPQVSVQEGMPHSLYRYEDGAWSEVLDLGSELGVSWAVPAACPDGTAYVAQHVIAHLAGGATHLYEIRPGAEPVVVLAGFSNDTLAMACAGNGDFLAATAIGRIYRFDRPRG